MNPAETAVILRQFNEWRRGDEDIPQFDPRDIGEAIDAAVEMIDRLEEAESECLEEARLNGIGAERELALMAKLEAAEKEVALKERVIDALGSELNAVTNERDALRDRIAEMERQEPVAWCSKQYGFVYMSRQPSQFEHGSILYLRNGAPAWRIEGSSKVALLDIASLPHGTVFYALPGAKGEEK